QQPADRGVAHGPPLPLRVRAFVRPDERPPDLDGPVLQATGGALRSLQYGVGHGLAEFRGARDWAGSLVIPRAADLRFAISVWHYRSPSDVGSDSPWSRPERLPRTSVPPSQAPPM